MPMSPLGRRDLSRAEQALERIGLLLRHDAVLPSFTGLVTGAPFRGSWWSHPRTHEIYDLLQVFDDGAGALAVKLVDGKVTYVHERLWPALLGVARGRAEWQRAGLSQEAHAICDEVGRRGDVRTDALTTPRSPRRSAAIGELERRLLVHADSVHTETGAHRKRLRTWTRWCRDRQLSVTPLPAAQARAEIDAAVERLVGAIGRKVELPWGRTASKS
jgi:hypothetical protein